jgi:alpha-mannosidase
VADQGPHAFTYSLLPHTGDLAASDVCAHAAAINQGLERFEALAAPRVALPVRVTGEGIELAVLKRAEKEPCLVARVVETRGVPARGELVGAHPRARIVETDLLEWNDAGARAFGRVALVLKPFEIRTFKVRS